MFVIFPKQISEFGHLVVIASVFAIVAYWWHIRMVQRNLIKLLIAKKNNWLYSSEKNINRFNQFNIYFSELFDKGDEGQNMQNEFWGKLKKDKNNKSTDFYAGIFSYKTVHRGSKGRRYTITHYENIIVLKLDKTLKTSFLLEPENLFTNFLDFFKKKEIDIESHEFNKAFAFSYNGKKDKKVLEIVQTLSPAVQINLLELKRKTKSFSILFKDNCVLFSFKGRLLPKMKTNFFRKIELDERDEIFIQKRLDTIFNISNKMIQYLD